MNVIGDRERGATELLHEKLTTSRVGRRWERILRAHSKELDCLMAVHMDVRDHIGDALCDLASRWNGSGALDESTLASVSRVLDDLQRLGGIELQHAVLGLRDELAMARGRRLDDVLAG